MINRAEREATAGEQQLGMAIGRNNDYLHVMSLERLVAHRAWDLSRVELVDSTGRPVPTLRTGESASATLAAGVAVRDPAEVYRRRLLAICRSLAHRVQREAGLAEYADTALALRTVNGSLGEVMAFFVGPPPLEFAAAAGDGDADPGDSGGFWHNLMHKAFG